MIYYLNREEWPTIPVPHDCVIRNISYAGDFLVFSFEQDIARHDSVQDICPNAKSLVMKMHLVDTFDIFQMKIRKFPKFKKSYVQIDFDKLAGFVEQKKVEYLYHYVAYQSLIVNLYYKTNLMMDLRTDFVEYIWET